MKERSPIQFLISNQKVILKVYDQYDRKPKMTWQLLRSHLPQLSQSMSFNTFKQYIPVFGSVKKELDKVRQKIEDQKDKLAAENRELKKRLDKVVQKNKNQKDKLTAKNRELKDRLDKVRQSNENNTMDGNLSGEHPLKISGWNLQLSKDGYYRCYRKINKKVHCIYIGKVLDVEKAMGRIRQKEASLRLDKS